MILLMSGNGILELIVIIYLIFHSPAIVTLIIGLIRLKNKPESAKKLLIFTWVYFLIGGGICGALLT